MQNYEQTTITDIQIPELDGSLVDKNEHLVDVPRIVIVGGGFGGLQAALHLGDTPAHVTVIDRNNHHL